MLGKVMVDFGNRQEALRHLERAKLTGVDTLRSEVCYWIATVHYNGKRPWTVSSSENSNGKLGKGRPIASKYEAS